MDFFRNLKKNCWWNFHNIFVIIHKNIWKVHLSWLEKWNKMFGDQNLWNFLGRLKIKFHMFTGINIDINLIIFKFYPYHLIFYPWWKCILAPWQMKWVFSVKTKTKVGSWNESINHSSNISMHNLKGKSKYFFIN